PAESLSMEDWKLRLGQDLRVYDPQGRLAWWGYLEAVSQSSGNLGYSVDIREMANRVAVRYRDSVDDEAAEFTQTAWFEDLESQAIFGQKEALFTLNQASQNSAERFAQMRLAEKAFPQIRFNAESRASNRDGRIYHLTCKGWMNSLSWRIWPGVNGRIENTVMQSGFQPLGNTGNNLRLAQSFLVRDSLKFNRIAVRLRKVGEPGDKLRLSLQADSAGKPSGLALTSVLISPEELQSESYSWQSLNFTPPVELTEGMRYWLAAERSGALNAENYYQLAVDENLNFKEGNLLLFNQSTASWKVRLPEADLLFKLNGLRSQIAQMRDVVEFGGQFLHGIEAQIGETLDLPPVSEEVWDCLRVFRFLMNYGNADASPLCSGSDPNRRLQVWQRKSASTAVLRLDEQARLINQAGQAVDAPWQAVGEWLAPEAARPLYLRGLSLEPATGKINFNP
ncbi:MAG: hypothetical protein KBA03_05425, partial [Anaerolineaceae bacterium]|nr:hypothetical protein [Anaerolineaceae bacterium]